MAKPEWGTKRSCPKCGTRFYDLGKDNPVACIECGEEWEPEPVLKSKQPIPYEADEKKKDIDPDSDLGGDDDDDLKDIENIDDDDDSPDNDVDLGGDDDLGVAKGKGDDDGNDDS
ncbi:TIGR02300 family protein [Qipengyuania sp. ASV99]|uniref:TIGR02300 family protein n=1 Tax=Qipengyuania sp. ASV99 TaxID=3399681 RepID=UPI003A4C6C7A